MTGLPLVCRPHHAGGEGAQRGLHSTCSYTPTLLRGIIHRSVFVLWHLGTDIRTGLWHTAYRGI
jgi:hypothetical protein